MLSLKSFMPACALAILCGSANATSVPLAADDQWRAFTVDSFASTTGGPEWIDADDSLASGYGSALSFDFVIAPGYVGKLTVVDAGLAGDVFNVFNQGVLLGPTSGVGVTQYDEAAPVFQDFDAALADGSFSHGAFTLAAGRYSIRGDLRQSVMFNGAPLNATIGAVKLSVSPVPEPAAGALLLAALGMAALIRRRHASR